MIERRPLGLVALSALVALIGLNHLLLFFVWIARPEGDPPTLAAEHVLVAALSVAAAIGIWQLRPWAQWLLSLAGAASAVLVLSLGPLLSLPAESRAGLWVGAASIAGLTALGVWYVRRAVREAQPAE